MTEYDALIAELRAGLEGVTPGPWEVEDRDTEDGTGKHKGYEVVAVSDKSWLNGKSIVDTYNSGVAEVRTEHDEDGSYSWDEQGRVDTAHIARCSPDNIRALLARLDAAERREEPQPQEERLPDLINELRELDDPLGDEAASTISRLRSERTAWFEEARRREREQYEHPWTVNEAARERIRAEKAEAERDEARADADAWGKAIVDVISNNPGIDWRDYPDGITAAEACAFFNEDMIEAWQDIEKLRAERDSLAARVVDLEEVLKPFERAAQYIEGDERDNGRALAYSSARYEVSCQDLLNVRAALSPAKQERT